LAGGPQQLRGNRVEVVLVACALLELLIIGTLGEQVTAIANIDSVFSSDALDVVYPWGKL
jgi:hypothetical protein